MIFASPLFLFLFLPIFLAIYYLLPGRFRSAAILIASYVFYGWWRVDFLALFFGATVLNYYLSLKLAAAESVTSRKRILAFGVTCDLLALGYFKYFNFGVASMNAGLAAFGIEPLEAWHVILPIGISFYIFHCISYLIDIYRGDAEVTDKFTDFAAFIALFPHLIAGPVLRFKDLAWQFRERTHSWDKFNEGAIRFMGGFCKKVLIADSVAPLADRMFALHDPSMAEAWIGALAYTAQLYFDFSGYSDMAVGLALMMGFRFIENFNHPYLSRSITEFWRRWHISLSTWLRDYLYISLGGNRKGHIRTYINLTLTMLLGGLWHGANWTFICWGAWHGVLLALERAIGAKRENPYPRMLAWPLTFLFVVLGWVMFRAPDVASVLTMYRGMAGLNGWGLTDESAWGVTHFELVMLAVAYGLILAGERLLPEKNKTATPFMPTWAHHLSASRQFGMIALTLVGVTAMIARSYSPFLYFQF